MEDIPAEGQKIIYDNWEMEVLTLDGNRITKVYHEADKREALTELMNEKKETLGSFEGLRSVRMVSVSDTATIAVSQYETEEQLKAVESRFQEVMVDLMPLIQKYF